MAGEIRKPLVIGKSKKPRCFKNMDISSLPVIWKFNKSLDDIRDNGAVVALFYRRYAIPE